MTNTVWTYVSACISVALGWLLNELGQWFRGRKDDRKIKKKVLYFLLETLFRFRRLDTSKIVAFMTSEILLRFPEEARNAEAHKQLEALYSQLVPKLVESEIEEGIEELKTGYKKSIDDLSLVDPLTAYRLRGKTKITDSFKELTDYFNHAKQLFPGQDEHIDEESKKIIDYLKPGILTSATEDLVAEIKRIAFSIGIITYVRAKNLVEDDAIQLDDDRRKKLNEYFDKFLPDTISF